MSDRDVIYRNVNFGVFYGRFDFLVRTEPDADKLVHEGNEVKQVNELEIAGNSSSSATGLQARSQLIFVYYCKIDKLKFLAQNLQIYAIRSTL